MRLDRCSACGHIREHHDKTGCLKPGCDCDGFVHDRVGHRHPAARSSLAKRISPWRD